ncbi:hypothetical protein [Lysobacter sp. HA35]
MKLRRVLPLFLCALSAAAGERPGDVFTRYAGFELEHATLSEVQAHLGASPLREQGDAGEYEAWICYAGKSAEVHFNSAEMGGGTELLGVTLLEPHRASPSCPAPREPLPAAVGPIKLGQSTKQFIVAAGRPVTWSGSTATATFEYSLPHQTNETLDVSVTVLGTFRNGRLVKIQTWKIETL